MRSLNWPNLRMIGDNTGFAVKKIYVEFNYLDDETLKFFRGGEAAFKLWQGRGWHNLNRAQALAEELLDYAGQVGEEYSNDLEEFKQRADKFIELVSKIMEPSFTYEDLLALGEQSIYLELGDFDIYDSCTIILKPSEGRFYWDARRVDDETQIWTVELRDLSKANFN